MECSKENFEYVAICVFVGIYIFVRLIENFITPRIPEFLKTEISFFFKYGIILIPIIYGFIYLNPKHSIVSKDEYQ